MLRLRNCIPTHIFSSSAVSPIQSPLHRLISIAAPGVFSSPGFAVEDYLVRTCGLTRAQALKASPKLSHLKSPSKPDAVLAFLADLGLSSADVAAVVAKDPQFLCAKVEKTLAPIAAGLTGLGLSHSEVARLVSLVQGRTQDKNDPVSKCITSNAYK
jgi:mTERF domain-containing protein